MIACRSVNDCRARVSSSAGQDVDWSDEANPRIVPAEPGDEFAVTCEGAKRSIREQQEDCRRWPTSEVAADQPMSADLSGTATRRSTVRESSWRATLAKGNVSVSRQTTKSSTQTP